MKQRSGVIARSSLGKGDLLRMLGAGVDPLIAAALLDYELPRAAEIEPQAVAAPGSGSAAAAPELAAPAAAATLAQEAECLPLVRVIGPILRPPSDEGAEMPLFLREGTACRAAELSRRGASEPGFVPLSPAARSWPVLRAMLRVPSESGELDAPKLVAALARGCLNRRLPRRRHAVWPARLQILLDQSTPMAPFRQDEFEVARWLRTWLPLRSIEELVVDEDGRIRTFVRTTRRARALARKVSNRRPDASTTLLALSDLGALDRDPERLALWRRIRSEAKRTSARTCALVVLDDERRAPDARAGWTVRPWARSVRRASVVAPAEALSALEELFLLLSPAAWVDFPLLRAMRQRVRAPGAGASLEAGAWLDPRVNRLADERGFVLRPDVLLELRAEFRGLPPSRRAEVAELLDAMHGHLGVVARAEELFALGDERAAGQARALIATYACLVRDRAGVDDSVEKAYLGRFETLVPKEQWQHDEPKALWALHHAAGDCFDRHPPEGLDLESIRWALERLPEPTSCRIWQRGTELEFVLAAAEERGPLSETGCTLCELPLRFRTLAVLQRFGNDRVQRATLALESTPAEHVRVPASPSESLVLGSDLARLEMRLEPRPPWATAWYRDEHGLWFETTVKGFWLTSVAQASASFSVRRRVSSRGARPKPPPVWQLEERSVPMQLAYPTWAIRLDQDDHGLFAELELASGVVMRLRWIPPGSFVMGSPEDEQGRWEDEGSKHRVELTRGYWLADAPCTQAQWEAVMENNPSRFRQDVDCPVEQVSWEDCQAFCGQLKERFPGVDARLPSEAEWEFACRAGKQSAYNDGSACSEPEGADPALLKLGWFKANSEGKTHGVRGKLPNAWGLYDMHGNVMEWCADWWQGDYRSAGEVDPQGPPRGSSRVVRGGSWDDPARGCRSAYRGGWPPSFRYDFLGFRLAAGQVSQTVSRQAEQGSGASGRPRSDEGRGV